MGSELRYLRKGEDLRLALSKATVEHVESHLTRCNSAFDPPLSARLDIACYAARLHARANCFEAWVGERLVGLVAAYIDNSSGGVGFISNVSVEGDWVGRGIASMLLAECRDYAKARGLACLKLEVSASNARAMELYERFGFVADGESGGFQVMNLVL